MAAWLVSCLIMWSSCHSRDLEHGVSSLLWWPRVVVVVIVVVVVVVVVVVIVVVVVLGTKHTHTLGGKTCETA